MERLMRGFMAGMPTGGEPPGGQPAHGAEPVGAPPPPAPEMKFTRLSGIAFPALGGFGAPAQPEEGVSSPPPGVGSPFPGFGGLFGGIPGVGGGLPPFFQPPPPPPPPPPPAPPPGLAIHPGLIRPEIFQPPFGTAFPWPFPPVLPPPPVVSKTATQLARSAIVTLDEASPDVLNEAVNTLRGRGIPGPELLDFLERRVRVGEVLNQLAGSWGQNTAADFADAFQMDAGKRDVMDAIVAIAILSDPQLDEEILVENTPQTNEQDLLDNRVIVDQWPPGGSVMQPPYMILVAVEYRNVAEAQELVRSILDQVGEHEGFKLTRTAIQRLRGR